MPIFKVSNTVCLQCDSITEVISRLSLWVTHQIRKWRDVPMQHKCIWHATMMNRRVFLSWDPSSAAGTLPWRGWTDNFRGSPGVRWKGRYQQGAGYPLVLGQLSEVVGGRGWQMEEYVSWSCIPTSQSTAPEESNSHALNHPHITWLLSLQVPQVKSKLAHPDGMTDNAQHVPGHFYDRLPQMKLQE